MHISQLINLIKLGKIVVFPVKNEEEHDTLTNIIAQIHAIHPLIVPYYSSPNQPTKWLSYIKKDVISFPVAISINCKCKNGLSFANINFYKKNLKAGSYQIIPIDSIRISKDLILAINLIKSELICN